MPADPNETTEVEAVLVSVPTKIWWYDEIEDHLPETEAFST